jgi:hypothetical protein
MTHLCSVKLTHTENTIFDYLPRGQERPNSAGKGLLIARNPFIFPLASSSSQAGGQVVPCVLLPAAGAHRACVVLGHFWRAK